MWTDSTTILQRVHSLEKQPFFVANCVTEILELTTVDEWNHLPTGVNSADIGTRGLFATTLLESSWSRGPDSLKSSNWACTDVITKIKSIKFPHEIEMMKKETHERTKFTADVTTNTSTFEWQKYSSHKNFLSFVAYKLPILLKFSDNRINSGCITDLDKLLGAERRLLLLLQTESFLAQKKNLLKLSPLSRLQYW